MKRSPRSQRTVLRHHDMPAGRLSVVVASLLASVVVCLVVSVAAADEPWVETRLIDSFLLRADYPIAAHETLFDQLGRLRSDVSETLGIEATDHPVDLYLFGDRTSYEAFLDRRYPKVPQRRALFIKTSTSHVVCAYRSDVLDVDLRHEATHALLHGALKDVPLWIDEGLAEYFEVAPAQRAAEHPHLAALANNPSLRVTPLAVLERKTRLAEMGRSDYRDAWAWVHFMLHGPREAHEELVEYLSDLADGGTPQPLSVRLGRRLPDVDRQLAQHLARHRLPKLARASDLP